MKEFTFSKFADLKPSSYNKNELLHCYFSKILYIFLEQPLMRFWDIWVLENKNRTNSKSLKMKAILFKNNIEVVQFYYNCLQLLAYARSLLPFSEGFFFFFYNSYVAQYLVKNTIFFPLFKIHKISSCKITRIWRKRGNFTVEKRICNIKKSWNMSRKISLATPVLWIKQRFFSINQWKNIVLRSKTES